MSFLKMLSVKISFLKCHFQNVILKMPQNISAECSTLQKTKCTYLAKKFTCPVYGKRTGCKACPFTMRTATGYPLQGKVSNCSILKKMAECPYGSKLKDCPFFPKMRSCPTLAKGCPFFARVYIKMFKTR
jgi:hypothetical protein